MPDNVNKPNVGTPLQAGPIPLQPMPTSYASGVADHHGKKLVVLQTFTPLGGFAFFFDPDNADTMADGLKEAARIARSGIVIAART